MSRELVELLAEHFLDHDDDSVGWANITEGYRNALRRRAERALSDIEREGYVLVTKGDWESAQDAAFNIGFYRD